VFNLSGSEMVFLLLIALVILGPDKLPDAMRRAGKAYAEFKKISTGFQTELKNALDEPMREMKSTADVLRQAADPKQYISPTTPKPASERTSLPVQPATPNPATDPAPTELNFGPGPRRDAFGEVGAADQEPPS
jgi:sec-independent protein translocase protein TatB